MRGRSVSMTICLAMLALVSGIASARDLSFEERADAQLAIERVYQAHQIGSSEPLAEAALRRAVEQKVRHYLEETAALRDVWSVEVTAEMLERETARMRHETRLPGRLRELFAALGDDPFLVQECLARPALVDRLARSFYARDRALHASAREGAETLRNRLRSGDLDPRADHADRTVLELHLEEDGSPGAPRVPGTVPLKVSPRELEDWRSTYRAGSEGISRVLEEADRFVVFASIEDRAERLRIAIYAVPKVSWDEWWERIRPRLDVTGVHAVASTAVPRDESGPEPLEHGGGSCPDDLWLPRSLISASPTPRVSFTAVWTGTHMIIWGGFPYVGTGALYDPAIDHWSPTTTANAPAARSNHTAVWTGSQMIVWGGTNATLRFSSGGLYNPTTDTWSTTSNTNAPSGRILHTAVWTGNSMLVWGGFGGTDESVLNDGARYNPAANTWTPITTLGAPEARAEHSAVWTGNRMVVWGGNNGGEELASGGRYDPGANAWVPTAAVNAPEPRFAHTAVWTGDRMVVWGGTGFAAGPFDTGARYDPSSDAWFPTTLAGAPAARSIHTAVWTGVRMIVWGGFGNEGRLDTGGLYDPAADTWSPTTQTNAPAARDTHLAVWTSDLMLVWGGWDREGFPIDSGGRYSPSTDTWTPISHGTSPSARWGHSAVWTGNLMIVWGGNGLASGGRYDPATNGWAPTKTVTAPEGRSGHTAVWTGSWMIIWGGTNASSNPIIGGRYDPLTDTWTPTSTVNAPVGRYEHTAVWTGQRMIVWGGIGGPPMSSGGSYNPTANVWSPLPIAGAPLPRSLHTAVWTGSVMIVWGGYTGVPGGLNTGGRYDPATNTWKPTSVLGAPSSRYLHTAVWTGSEMLVWGGTRPGGALATGGRYMRGDRWAPLTTAGAPSPRYRHTAVWTGSHMVVWGGVASVPLDTGGLYGSVNGSWLPMSTTGAPVARYIHTAVWTGDSMLVWGGSTNPESLNDGGAYVHSVDDDLDGFTECGGDCDDARSSVHPDAPQQGCDGVNNDCNDPTWPTVAPAEADADGDQFLVCEGDCDDTRTSVHPGATEICDGLDNDCNQLIDDDADGFDTDFDGHPNACDNCPAAPNPSQTNIDGDAAGDACDCRPNDPAVMRIPAHVTGLRLAADRRTISWDSLAAQAGSAIVYDVTRGVPGEWPVGQGPSESCLASGLIVTSVQDAAIPASQAGFWYLVRGRNACGTGPYGLQENGGHAGAAWETSFGACP